VPLLSFPRDENVTSSVGRSVGRSVGWLEWVQRQVMQECSLYLISHSVTCSRSLRANLTVLTAQLVSTVAVVARSTRQTHQNAHNKHPKTTGAHTPATSVRRPGRKDRGHVAPRHPLLVKSASQLTTHVSVVAQSCPASRIRSNGMALDGAVREAEGLRALSSSKRADHSRSTSEDNDWTCPPDAAACRCTTAPLASASRNVPRKQRSAHVYH